ncbi:hypothetical protein WA026_001826 [Henosepilachna vigintioctopunctata]|uniref:Protein yellow n=1 Tax=Henosepilachna vigintioctopunctata TaxID=420089 RepID=A0AAW1ULL8_9CUCU
MAVDNWFQTWTPPSHILGHYNSFHPEHNQNETTPGYNHGSAFIAQDRKKVNPTDFLPFLASLGLLNPPISSVDSSPEYFTKTPQQDLYDNLHSFDQFSYGSSSFYNEKTGPFKTKYAWKKIDFKYESEERRQIAIESGEFIIENNLPLGVEVWRNKLFVTLPKWKDGVPATLTILPTKPKELSPALAPYPNWDWHRTESCSGITSVFRVQADHCGRLWVLDSGQIEITIKPKQVCPPAIFVFDLNTDEIILRYELPEDFIKQDSLYSNIIVDIRNGDCANAHAYLTDVWRYGLVVFSLMKKKSWRITDHLFYPEPLAAAYKVHDLEFEWTDGLFGLALGPWNEYEQDRILYFHPMSSFREFYVKTSVICNETGWKDTKHAFKVIGQSRGKSGHVSASAIDRNQVMFYNLVTRDSVGCWNTKLPYRRQNLGVVARHNEKLVFPNDLKIDNEENQSIWIVTNKLPFYLYRKLNHNKINFRILSAYTSDAVRGTVCDPRLEFQGQHNHFSGEEDCY